MEDPVLIPRMTPEERARFDAVLAAVDRNVAEDRLRAAEARIVQPPPVTERRRGLVASILSLLGGRER